MIEQIVCIWFLCLKEARKVIDRSGDRATETMLYIATLIIETSLLIHKTTALVFHRCLLCTFLSLSVKMGN